MYNEGVILREILHAHFPTLTELSTVRDAVDKMDIYQFSGLVVVNSDFQPIAVITEGDICRAVNQRDSLSEMARESIMIHATQSPTMVESSMEIGEAFHKMLGSGLTILPIVEDNRLCGVVFRMDLMEAMFLDSQVEN